MDKTFPSELLVTKMEALQEQNTALLESSKKLQEYLQVTEGENHRLVRALEETQEAKERLGRFLSPTGMGLSLILMLSAVLVFSLSTEKNGLDSRFRRLTQSARRVTQENRHLSKKLKEAVSLTQNRNASLELELKKAKADFNSAQEEKTYLEDILIHNAREIEALKKGAVSGETPRTIDLGSIKVPGRKSGAPAATTPGETTVRPDLQRYPKKEGRVRAVNEDHGFIIVDLGKVDDLRENDVLIVRKNGQKVATLSVIETRDALSACSIQDLVPGYAIQVNDAVSK